jgi:hypothetical protein
MCRRGGRACGRWGGRTRVGCTLRCGKSMRELMGRMRAWPPSIGQVCACPTGRRVADGEEERLATKDSAHTADLRNLASDPGGGAGTARGTGSAGARRPGCGPSHRDEKREEQRAPAGQQVAPGSRGRRRGSRWWRAPASSVLPASCRWWRALAWAAGCGGKQLTLVRYEERDEAECLDGEFWRGVVGLACK